MNVKGTTVSQAFDPQALIERAIDARTQAYAKYSTYQVGAALLAKGGQTFSGCNVENISYGLTICAERVAVFNAVAAGICEFTALAIATADGGSPCGACRQVLAEFCDDLLIILVAADQPDKFRQTTLAELLPQRFDSDL